VGSFDSTRVGRVREGGETLQEIDSGAPCFACMLGGEDRRTLFMLTAEWRMSEGFEENIARLTTGPRTGKVLVAPAGAPGVGWP
jgi:sugar lactone lactonase YvrE